MARDDKTKGELEEIIVSLAVDQDAVRHRIHRMAENLMEKVAKEGSDRDQWVDKVIRDTEPPEPA